MPGPHLKNIPEKLNEIYKEVIKLLGLTIQKDYLFRIEAHDKKYDYYFFADKIKVTPRNDRTSCVFRVKCNTFGNYSAQKVADYIKEAFKKHGGTYTLYRGRLISEEESDASAKIFAYHGQIITASSKQEAIKQIVKSAKKAPIPKLTKEQETKLKEMYIDFWPYYGGAVDVGKMGLSGNPKAERRSNKIYEYLKSIYGDDYVYSIDTNFDVSLSNLQTKLEDELWNKNVDNVNRWKNRNCRGALFQLAKMSLNDILDKIKKLDLNKTFEQIIKTDDAIDL